LGVFFKNLKFRAASVAITGIVDSFDAKMDAPPQHVQHARAGGPVGGTLFFENPQELGHQNLREGPAGVPSRPEASIPGGKMPYYFCRKNYAHIN